MPKRFLFKLYGILGTLGIFLLFGFARLPEQNLKVTFLDVGQGDAILIHTPLQQKILIDAGPDANILPAISPELGFFEKKIQLMIVTHPDADHIAGFTEILRRFEVENILFTGVQHPTQWYRDILQQIDQQGIPTILAHTDTDFRFGDVVVDVFYPHDYFVAVKPADANALSVSTRITFGTTAVVLTGDLDLHAEEKVLATEQNLSAQIFKLSHHGSRTANSEEFIAAVDPEIVIVSAGVDNKFDHPHAEVIERVADKKILETAKEGNIRFVSDGRKWRSD
jgi:competence protein ComEC